MLKENIRNVSFILVLGASRVSTYWLAYNVRPDAVKLKINAKLRPEFMRSAGTKLEPVPPHLVAPQTLLLMWMH